jgi:hypothetical protein
MQIAAISFRPPLAFGHLGGASTPMDNYVWRDDPTIHGSARTVIEPALTLQVLADGSIFPATPTVLRFRENTKLRPIAPFFELWATVGFDADDAGHQPGSEAEVPLTGKLLQAAGGRLSDLVYGVTVANRKAARRTLDDSNAFVATVRVCGDDFEQHQLLASSHVLSGATPLVDPARPIPLGSFRVIRPVAGQVNAVDLDILRVRFIPAAGEVYGPPTAVTGRDNCKGPYEIVRPANRILNAAASWVTYRRGMPTDPQPADTYDGADQGENQSLGVVDDTCDGIITASLAIGARNLSASCRICVGPPDFAPDRRPFISLADDLADRDREPFDRQQLLHDGAATAHRFADLFQRVWETASLTNLDAIRARALEDNADDQKPPRTDEFSMRYPKDAPYADAKVEALIPREPPAPHDLVFTKLIAQAHQALADEDEFIEFVLSDPTRLRRLIRPAYGAFHQLPGSVSANAASDDRFRDPRITRDRMHDMRMPPYMRDEIAQALALTWRQYQELMSYVDIALAETGGKGVGGEEPMAAGIDQAEPAAIVTALRRRVQQRLRMIGGIQQ